MQFLFWGLVLFDVAITVVFFFAFRTYVEHADEYMKREDTNVISGVLAAFIFITVPSLAGLWVFGWRQILIAFS